MMIWIHSDRPLTLKRLLNAWKQLDFSQVKAGDGSPSSHEERLSRIVEASLPYRRQGEEGFWQEEEAALYTLSDLIGRSLSVAVTPLVVPLSVPALWLPLLTGWEVRRWQQAEELFSPLALLWLREWGARTDHMLSGTVLHAVEADGVGLLLCQRDDGPSIVHEQRNHTEEHVDEAMFLLQVNLDDASPEWMAYAMSALFAAGANDVSFFPMTMKKGRPGTMVQVMCYASQLEVMKELLFRETTTFGVRYFPVVCHRLARRFCQVETRWGEVTVKLGYLRGERVQVAPEYAHCAALAERAGVPLKQVYQEALAIAVTQTPQQM
ncbi:LarC family nickel insertion protein [Brevibacillus humidisoli]|uniref:nickel insertion protein n=1 Tax=Brevibacillus humidisoli TaxID=2895522 RepID=UPI001E4746C0|nr:nickel insertion protein [Brevibacillus humidisoli]UFJ39693.1 LarC family nickel insertion protein [Brevibacillus humidisoli]